MSEQPARSRHWRRRPEHSLVPTVSLGAGGSSAGVEGVWGFALEPWPSPECGVRTLGVRKADGWPGSQPCCPGGGPSPPQATCGHRQRPALSGLGVLLSNVT